MMSKCVFVSKLNYWSKRLWDLLIDYNKNLSEEYRNDWIFIDETNFHILEELSDDIDYIFFFHWSNIVNENIFNKYECIVLHTSPLPYFKGGSPIQNQINNGIIFSSVNALKMEKQIDSGPVYCSKCISLQGSLDDIWSSITYASFEIIREIIENKLKPYGQEYEGTYFKRLIDNRIDLNCETIENVYNVIRMRDGYGFPKSYIEFGNFKIEFSRASLVNGEFIIADARIQKK